MSEVRLLHLKMGDLDTLGTTLDWPVARDSHCCFLSTGYLIEVFYFL